MVTRWFAFPAANEVASNAQSRIRRRLKVITWKPDSDAPGARCTSHSVGPVTASLLPGILPVK